MTLKTPNLDDRKFQDIVREARSRIPLYCPKWTDHNLSDPGITMIELFAWMVDMLLYRLNRVPEKNYIKFMELIGIHLNPPQPAKVNVTFRLSAPQPGVTVIPCGTEVATVRTETRDAITFTTDFDLTITLPDQDYAFITPDDSIFNDCLAALRNPDVQVPVFQEVPQENNALYLGYTHNLSNHTLVLTVESSIEGIGVDPRDPPLAWEYWNGLLEKWLPMMVELDTTGGLNTNGQIILHIPGTCAMREVNHQYACWLRCRATRPRPDQRPYNASPKVRRIVSESIGGAVQASHAFRATNEVLGRSNGEPGQRLQLQHTPVLSRLPGETLQIEGEQEGEFELWQEVEDFADSQPDSRHFTLDSVTGEIQLGPSVRQSNGEERQFGKVPSAGRLIRFTSYRCGGGVIGNVGERTINVLKSSIPYVAAVTNFEPAKGGTDPETLENAKLRAPKVIRSYTRAVTAEDFEVLALQASPAIARAKCLSPGSGGQNLPPGSVRLMLIPKIEDTDRYLSLPELEIPRQVRETVQAYLDERRLLGTSVQMAVPEYIPVVVAARIKARLGRNLVQLKADIEKQMYHYINPVCGGYEENGWPFGRSLFIPELFGVIQKMPDVDYVEEMRVYTVDARTGERQEAVNRLNIPAHSLLCSGKHEILVVP